MEKTSKLDWSMNLTEIQTRKLVDALRNCKTAHGEITVTRNNHGVLTVSQDGAFVGSVTALAAR